MYDISQLNDLLVPELLDIAEQFDISNAKKLNKQDLVNKILENQSIMSTDKKNEGEKPKRKRIIKTADAGPVEEVVHARSKKPEAEKKPVKKHIEEDVDVQPITDQESTIPAAIAQMLQEEDVQEPETDMGEEIAQQPTKQ